MKRGRDKRKMEGDESDRWKEERKENYGRRKERGDK